MTKYVLLIYQGTTPLPGSDRWKGLPEAEQKKIYVDYAEIGKTAGVTPGLPQDFPAPRGPCRCVTARPRSRPGPIWAKV